MGETTATVVIYHVDDEETPYKATLSNVAPFDVTLHDFKSYLNLTRNYKFFFKSEDQDFGVVKEEISDDHCKLPVSNNRVEAWLVSADGSSHSDGKNDVYGAFPTSNRLPPPMFQQRGHYNPSEFTSETESTISSLPGFHLRGVAGKLDRRAVSNQYYDKGKGRMQQQFVDNSSVITSDLDTTSVVDSEDDDQKTKISTSTNITSVSQQHLSRRKKKRRILPRQINSKMSTVSSVTESSMSLNVITVVLNVEAGGFLGISIVGETDGCHGDGGIRVGSIMNGGAVGLDGRIQQGDLILQVNDIPFDGLTNDEAVRVMREVVKQRTPGPVKLVVAKCWDVNPNRTDFSRFRTEPVRPIDPGAWVKHTNALMTNEIPLDYPRTMSPQRALSNNSGSFTSPVPPADLEKDIKLDVHIHDMQTIVRHLARPDSGLEVRDRKWLKISIPNAFIGSDLVDWLHTRVHGLGDRKDARKFATRMLKDGYIKQTVNKITFADQCYYTFSDLCGAFFSMGLDAPREEGAHSDPDTVGPLPPPPSLSAQTPPWTPSLVGVPSYPVEGLYAPSMASGYATLPHYQQPLSNLVDDDIIVSNTYSSQPPVAAGRSDMQSSASGTSGNSSGSERKSRKNPLAVAAATSSTLVK